MFPINVMATTSPSIALPAADRSMPKPELQRIHLVASLMGLSAWVDGKYLGTADVMGDRVTIEVSARQVQRGPIMTDQSKVEPIANCEDPNAVSPESWKECWSQYPSTENGTRDG
jgi:hypothetical protein